MWARSAGDGVLLLVPCFDIYFQQVQLAGGVPQLCPLRVVGEGDAQGATRGATWCWREDGLTTHVLARWMPLQRGRWTSPSLSGPSRLPRAPSS